MILTYIHCRIIMFKIQKFVITVRKIAIMTNYLFKKDMEILFVNVSTAKYYERTRIHFNNLFIIYLN